MWNWLWSHISRHKLKKEQQSGQARVETHISLQVTNSQNATLIGQARDVITKITVAIPEKPLLLAVIVVVLVLIAALLTPQVEHWINCPSPMLGDFNIAIMRFSQNVDGEWQPTTRSTSISRFLADYLDEEYKAADFGLSVQVLYDDTCNSVRDSREAAEVAQSLNAQIVIYGTLEEVHQAMVVRPRFYVEEASFEDEVTEVTGPYEILGFTIDCSGDDCLEEDILTTRAEILLAFTEGLTYFATNDPAKMENARRAFERAIRLLENLAQFAPDVPDSRVVESTAIFYIMAARTYRYLGDFEQAQASIEEAFNRHPNYDRAYLEQGNLFYDLGRHTEPWDVAYFNRAAEDYRLAAEYADELANSHTLAKSLVNLGFTYVTLGHLAPPDEKNSLIEQGLPYFAEVIQMWQGVEAGDNRLQDLAAIAAYAQGIAYEQLLDLSRAAESYRHCIEWVIENPNQRELCETQLAVVTTPSPKRLHNIRGAL